MKFSNVIGSLISLRRNSALRGMAWVFVLRTATTILNFVLITLAARTLGQSTFGTYSILFSAAGLFCVIATFGQQIVSMRSWSEYSSAGQQHLLKGAMIFSGLACLAGSTLVAIPFYAWMAATHGALLAATVTFYLVALSIVLTTSHLVRTAIGVGIGDGISNLLLVVPPILYLLFCLFFRAGAEISTIFLMMATGGSIAILIHVVSMWHGAHARSTRSVARTAFTRGTSRRARAHDPRTTYRQNGRPDAVQKTCVPAWPGMARWRVAGLKLSASRLRGSARAAYIAAPALDGWSSRRAMNTSRPFITSTAPLP